ncbi:MAG: ATP synthase F0 subunit B [Deltaproteobacteria bacterium]|jgi:F-type H+-transporting ATPase subunit b|nr:ATP synthase F0 subunit B [Deltaproteobacteria bacterium]
MIAVDWTLIVQLINFLVLMFILNVLLYKPILKILKTREDAYNGLKDKADGFKNEIDQGEAKEKAFHIDLLQDGSKAQNELKQQGQAREREILEEAQSASSKKLEEARLSIAQDVAKARQDLEAEAKLLARELATKILGREVLSS